MRKVEYKEPGNIHWHFRGMSQTPLHLLRKIALNIIGRDKTTKASVRARREKAAWNDAYMLKLMAG